jgi:hypothetical protein
VQQAADDGFLEYVMINCMTASSGGLNFLGQTPVTPAKCLVDWLLIIKIPILFLLLELVEQLSRTWLLL